MVSLIKVWVCPRIKKKKKKAELTIERADPISDSNTFVDDHLYKLLWKIFPCFLLGIWSMLTN